MEYIPCEWESSVFLIFSENVGSLVYYTHISALIISLFLGFLVLINNYRETRNRVLFLFTVLFSVWIYFDLILWASPSQEMVMFFWSAIVPIELLMYLSALYLVYLFSFNTDNVPFKTQLLFSLTLIPVLLFGHTNLNVIGLSADCDTGAYEGILIQYMYFIELIIILFAVLFLILGTKKIRAGSIEKKKALLVGLGAISMLTFFTAGNLTLTFGLGPNYEQFKLFGMPVFAALVSYSIIRYNAFSVKTAISDFLITTLWILLFSTLLFEDYSVARWLILITSILFAFAGITLSRSIRQEVSQKQELEVAAKKLERLNYRLMLHDKQKSEFVSIASHQLKTPVAAIRGYTSMLLDGSYGDVPAKMKKPLEHIEQSAKFMATSVQDFLNVSRIESGNMEYNYSDFNLVEKVHHVVDSLRPEATKKGLLLIAKTQTEKSIVHADEGKTIQIIQNLLTNALKYTQKGSIRVCIDSTKDHIFVHITDTGIGFSEETKNNLFQKFSRAYNANSVNIEGTGLGLFVAKKMAEKMGGDITCHSKGEGLGATFTFSLPIKL